MSIVAVGIEQEKSVFVVHDIDEGGKRALVRPGVPRGKLLEWVAKLPPGLIGMEACSGVHQGAREFMKFGHTVRLMAPKFIAPHRMIGERCKNDVADAAGICEAVTRPSMRFARTAPGLPVPLQAERNVKQPDQPAAQDARRCRYQPL